MRQDRRAGRRFAAASFVGAMVAVGLASHAFALPPLSLPRPQALGLPAPPQGQIRLSEDDARRMTVPVFVNGKGPFPFVVDTGADRTVVSTDLAAELHLPSDAAVVVNGTGGADLVPTAHIDDLVVGGRHLANITAPTLSAENLGAYGMLGVDCLRDQRVTIDFKHRTLSVEPSQREKRRPGEIVVRAKSVYGQLVLVDASFSDRPILVILDSGAQNTIGNSAFEKLVGFEGMSSIRLGGDVVSVTGRITPAMFSTLRSVQIGGIELQNQPVAFADLHTFGEFDMNHRPAMLLGMDTLRAFDRVVIDFGRHEVRFKLGPPQPPAEHFIMVADAG